MDFIRQDVFTKLCSFARFDGCDHWDATGVETVPDVGNGYASEMETCLFLYSFVRRTKPAVIVETGTHRGLSSAWLALGLLDNRPTEPKKRNRLYTCDEYDHHPENLWNHLGVFGDVIEYKVADSKTVNFNLPGKIDLLFLDGAHGWEETIKHELVNFKSHMTEKTYTIIHDYTTDPNVVTATNNIRWTELLIMPELRGMVIGKVQI